jgi:hypothetical protein
MTRDAAYDRWVQRADTLRDRLADLGLERLLVSLAQVARPLGPLAAQVLWVAQPTLSTFEGTLSQEAGALANLLDDPMALDHLLTQLAAGTRETE